ncbi:MAG: nitrous oxide reductase accessory protein NosL [Gemmatimonadaceae bacterium]|nr:nitrous oxide reductase accessory protein NosL [Gemmatimonadaceae bacterium]
MNVSRRTQLLFAIAAIALGSAVAFPLWSVALTAPQYPEGLGMYIWAHTVSGIGPNDLQNINGLNHYIGMKPIVPESIPELKVMRPGIIAMSLLGLVVAYSRNLRFMRLWTGALVLAALIGLVDFWRWEYDYGHNLDLENAPIKVPGMSYQPPLIGSKNLLNFTATSLPATGGVLAISAVLLAVGVSLAPRRRSAAVAALVALGACDAGPRPLIAGQDSCGYCRMSIDDVRFGALVITAKGKQQTFDSIECAASFVASLPAGEAPRSIWVANFANPGEWVDATQATFLHASGLRSPMGRELVAFTPAFNADSLARTHGGNRMTWADVQFLVAQPMSSPTALHQGHAH